MSVVEVSHDIPALPDRRDWLLIVDGKPFQRYLEEREAQHAAAIIRGDIKNDLRELWATLAALPLFHATTTETEPS
jgi:hypothetical protein